MNRRDLSSARRQRREAVVQPILPRTLICGETRRLGSSEPIIRWRRPHREVLGRNRVTDGWFGTLRVREHVCQSIICNYTGNLVRHGVLSELRRSGKTTPPPPPRSPGTSRRCPVAIAQLHTYGSLAIDAVMLAHIRVS